MRLKREAGVNPVRSRHCEGDHPADTTAGTQLQLRLIARHFSGAGGKVQV